MTKALLSIVTIILVIAPTLSVQADLVVNEVMANEPGGSTSLEWLELYNDSPSAVVLGSYRLQVDGALLIFNGLIQPYGYQVICRKLFPDGGSPAFEEYWGDNSGVWGDDPSESFPVPIEGAFPGLVNSGGTVALLDGSLVEISSLSWTEAGTDGFSWERVAPIGDAVGQSVDRAGSTPGLVNSLTPLLNDLALDTVQLSIDGGLTEVEMKVINVGINSAPAGFVTLLYDDEADSVTYGSRLDMLQVPQLEPGDSAFIVGQYSLTGMYVKLAARLDDDDRLRNNRWAFVAPAEEFPPVMLSEVLANPKSPLETEWVEIASRSDRAADIAGWQLGDAGRAWIISADSLVVEPGAYAVLADDSTLFADYYTGFEGFLIQPEHWPGLNDGGDTVRLIDRYGIEADRLGYVQVFDSNRTWSRAETVGDGDRWGRSEAAGGSPGEANRVVLITKGTATVLKVIPEVFSPDGDGIDETTIISVEAPAATAYSLKIFDRTGRGVRTLVDGEAFLRTEYVWDGTSDSGSRLPIGIYIIYFEAAGVESVNQTVVVAR
jgi:hypothetical protein